MYIVAIAWIYVTLMVSVMQPTVFRGVVTFLATGLGPLALLLWLVGTPARRRRQALQEPAAADAPAAAAHEEPEDAPPARPEDEPPAQPEDAPRRPRDSAKPGD